MSPPETAPLEPEDPSRRRLLAIATGAIGAGLGLGALSAACAALASPIRGGIVQLEGGGLADLGPLDQFAPGVARKVVVRGRLKDGFFRLPERLLGGAVVVRDGERARVFSSTCPHAGCDVEIAERGAEIACPCHKSVFNLDGSVASGPAPRALDALDCAVEQGRVRCRFERFRIGIAEKTPI